MSDLEQIAEGDEHARWIVENHVGKEPYGSRQRCSICEAWWPCDLVSLAALAVLRAADMARVQGENERLREALNDAKRLVFYHHDTGAMRALRNGLPCPVCSGEMYADAVQLKAAINAALAPPTAPQDAEAGAITLHLCQSTDPRCVPIMRCERGAGHDGQHTAWDGRYSWSPSAGE